MLLAWLGLQPLHLTHKLYTQFRAKLVAQLKKYGNVMNIQPLSTWHKPLEMGNSEPIIQLVKYERKNLWCCFDVFLIFEKLLYSLCSFSVFCRSKSSPSSFCSLSFFFFIRWRGMPRDLLHRLLLSHYLMTNELPLPIACMIPRIVTVFAYY